MDKTKPKGIVVAIGFFALYACLMIGFQSIFTFALMGIKFSTGTRDQSDFENFATNNLLIAVLLTIVSVGLTFYLIFQCLGQNIRYEWRIYPFNLLALIISIICAVAYSIAFTILSNQMEPGGANPIFHSADYYSSIFPGLGPLLMALNILLAAPVVEEIVMRGVVYTRIDNAYGPWTAIIINSLLFGLIHISAGGLLLAVGAILMGLVFSLIYAKTNSLTVCIIAHSAANIPDFITYLLR